MTGRPWWTTATCSLQPGRNTQPLPATSTTRKQRLTLRATVSLDVVHRYRAVRQDFPNQISPNSRGLRRLLVVSSPKPAVLAVAALIVACSSAPPPVAAPPSSTTTTVARSNPHLHRGEHDTTTARPTTTRPRPTTTTTSEFAAPEWLGTTCSRSARTGMATSATPPELVDRRIATEDLLTPPKGDRFVGTVEPSRLRGRPTLHLEGGVPGPARRVALPNRLLLGVRRTVPHRRVDRP